MKKYKRSHNLRRIKQDDAYHVKEVMGLFPITQTTFYNWIKEGLKKLDNQYPTLIHGSDLYAFLQKRQSNRKTKLKDNQFYCVRCKKATHAKNGTETLTYSKTNKPLMQAQCSICNVGVRQFMSKKS